MTLSQYDPSTEELKRADINLLEDCQDIFMIGRLRKYNPTKEVSNGSIQFFIDPLCEDPIPVMELRVFDGSGDNYIGFDNQQPESMLPTYYDISSYEGAQKEQDLEEFYRNQLIIFHPFYSKSGKNGKWFKHLRIVNLVRDNLDQFFSFTAVPRVQMDVAKFEQALKKGDYFDLPGYLGDVCDPPLIVLCGSYAYRLKIDDGTDYLEANPNLWERWKCVNYDDIVKIDMTSISSYKTDVIRASDNIVFMETNLYNAVMQSTDYVLMEEDRRQEQIAQMQNLKAKSAGSDIQSDDVGSELGDSDEIQFIKGLRQLTIDNGLQYKFEDLINFHISVKTNPLTILAGMSGTGKSRLALNYAKMLDLSEDNKNLLFMPISPSYTEPSDVLGYLNSMNGLYVPSETGLVQFLIHADQNPDQMHMVIFDEMNLSQVEYWFSPFISILEKDKNERILSLYDEDAHCINEKVYPSKIKIGENIIFVGTVNIDDTTKDFSNRLLDRTFVISLEKVNFTDFYKEFMKSESVQEKFDVTKAKCKDVNQFRSWCNGNDRKYMIAFKEHNNELQFFDEGLICRLVI